MKFNVKTIVAMAALVAAGSSHAGYVSGALAGTTGNGTLALVAWNQSNGSFYIRDTGFKMNDFLPSGGSSITGSGELTPVYDKTPSAGLTLNAGNTAGFGDSAFSTWLGSTTAADVRWTVVASDRLGTSSTNRFREIGAIASGASFTPVSNGSIDNGNLAINGFTAYTFGLSTTGTLNSTQLASANGSYINQPFLATALDSAANLYYWTRSANSGSTGTAANVLAFGNLAGYATLTLSSAGDLTYSLAAEGAQSAVPVPAAAWLLGSGLVAMGSAARRRKAAAKA